jgi:hypothetical protein
MTVNVTEGASCADLTDGDLIVTYQITGGTGCFKGFPAPLRCSTHAILG